MAGDKIFVGTKPFTVKKIFDNKLKAKVPPLIAAATEKGLKGKTDFTCDKNQAKDQPKFYLGGSVELNMTGAGPKAMLEIKIAPAIYKEVIDDKSGKPKETLIPASTVASGKLPGPNVKKIEKEIEFLIDDVWAKNFVAKKALPIFDKLAKS